MDDRTNRTWWALFAALILVLIGAGGFLGWNLMRERQVRHREADEAARQQAEVEEQKALVEAWRTFGPLAPPTPDEEREFSAFFARFTAICERGDWADLDALVSVDRLAALADFPTDESRRAFRKHVQDRFHALLPQPFLSRTVRTTIHRVRRTPDGSGAIVTASHQILTGEPTLHFRWWLARGANGWQTYDAMNLEAFYTHSEFIEQVLGRDEGPTARVEVLLSQQIPRWVSAVKTGDLAMAKEFLPGKFTPVADVWKPFPCERLALEGLAAAYSGDIRTAEARFDEAERIRPGVPVLQVFRTIAYARTGNPERALAVARRYAEEFGEDDVVRFWEGFALEESGASSAAADVYRAALTDDPNRFVALNGLRRVTTTPDELAARIAASRSPATVSAMLAAAAEADTHSRLEQRIADPDDLVGFDRLRDWARRQWVASLVRDGRALHAYEEIGPVDRTVNQIAAHYLAVKDAGKLTEVFNRHRDSFPNDPWLWFWGAQLHALRGNFAEAVGDLDRFRTHAAVSPANRFTASVLVVRTWVRAGNAAKAKEAVNEIGPEWVPAGLRAAVLALAGDTAGVERMMAARVKAPHGLAPLYADADFSRLIAGEKFADVRKKYPR